MPDEVYEFTLNPGKKNFRPQNIEKLSEVLHNITGGSPRLNRLSFSRSPLAHARTHTHYAPMHYAHTHTWHDHSKHVKFSFVCVACARTHTRAQAHTRGSASILKRICSYSFPLPLINSLGSSSLTHHLTASHTENI